jgi:T6SS, Phospholipase effector Tle1-like, catalytic domain
MPDIRSETKNLIFAIFFRNILLNIGGDMKRLIVCCDGTWNNPEQEINGIAAPTNVVKIYNAIADYDTSDVKQLKYYHPGVGGENSGLIDSVLGGTIGLGISRHICSAYHWLGNNYEEGDEIYLFGFSRGAFTARSLGGFLSRGLLDLRDVPSDISWARVGKAYDEGYREDLAINKWAETDWTFFNQRDKTPIHFIGVWDTVGSLGVPDDLEIFNLFDNKKKWKFHNTAIGENIKHARHAMAMDEVRSCFSVTRWSNAAQHSDTIELWFPGVHSDIGGGYVECDLSNGALKWMMKESETVGLVFREGVKQTIKDNPLGVMHKSYKGVFAKLRSRPRNIPAMSPENNKLFHESARKRQQISPIEYPPYHPTRILAIGESVTVDVYANKRWNATNVYLAREQAFTFSATGKWLDSKDSCDWEGTQDDNLTTSDIIRAASSFLGKFEKTFQKLTNNYSTDFIGTKRVENIKWFTLVGAIANDSGSSAVVKNDGSAVPHQYVELPNHKSTPLAISSPGYLYCFPNDVWSLYDNNHGSIQLSIKRVV